MQITDRHIDDFKSDRKGITPPLPMVLRLVPILFYGSIAIAVILSSLFFLQFRLAIQKRDGHKAQASALNAERDESKTQRTALEAQIKRATDIQNWVESSRPLQPLVVEIARSMAQKSSIADLQLERMPDDPSQIRLGIKIGTDSTKQLDLTMEKIALLDYRAFSPTREFGRGELDYKAILVRRSSKQAAEEQPPTAP
ncbi:MAG: hypothetical protein WCS65_00260 [Verrucomicrobiae bacterium]